MPELEAQKHPNDPLASLHKMSTTAGIVAADYVAINNMAVLAAVAGVATALAIVWPWLGLIAIVAVALGVVALVQVRRSNGTQSGRGIAIAGIVLAVLFAGGGAGKVYMEEAALRPDKQAIDSQIRALQQHLQQRNYVAAYALFDPLWQKVQDRAGFESAFTQGIEASRRISQIEPTQRYNFYSAGGSRMVETRARLLFENQPTPIPIAFTLRRQPDGEWLIVFTDFFPEVDGTTGKRLRSP